MTSEKGGRKDKNQNIQVFVRLRPLNQRERDIKSLGVVEVVNNREVVVRQSQQTSHTKKFTFDRAFGPHATQLEIYQDVVSPLIEEVLCGYNCTVFAYGQTGTGKTHTMVGEHTGEGTNWQNDPLAGIIPRALSQLFDELRLSNTEYTVRVSYLELYNEELFDLLSSSEDNSKLRIYEDVTRKGSNIVNGLEEITVYNKREVYKIMAQGQERKRVASTLMNAQSSRSHTVFTIVVHMKENSPEGEELVKIGKLNLVDLAGSENISKAGSDNPAKRERARECVNINQSLLTLGRVITALVERHPHIPYRESKLTRILQESLGGRTKTSIIATVSPGHKDLEETMSTLEYANRAKNIQNKPEVNQKMTKKAILKEYAEEIDRLKRDLQAARDKNGVYLASETFAEITLKQEEQRKEIQELLLAKRAVEEKREQADALFTELSAQLQHKQHQLEATSQQLDLTKGRLANTNNALQSTRIQCEEQRHLVARQAETEARLGAQARRLLDAADTAAGHAGRLHNTVDRRRMVEATNLQVTQTYRSECAEQRLCTLQALSTCTEKLSSALTGLYTGVEGHCTESIQCHKQNKDTIQQLMQKLDEAMAEIKTLTATTQSALSNQTDDQRAQLHTSMRQRTARAHQLMRTLTQTAAEVVQRANSEDASGRGRMEHYLRTWLTNSSQHIAALRASHTSLVCWWREGLHSRLDAARKRAGGRTAGRDRRGDALRACREEIAEESSLQMERISKQLSDVEREREETSERLRQWVEEERRSFEERLAKHVAEQTRVLEERLAKKTAEIEEEKQLLQQRMSRRLAWHEEQVRCTEEDLAFETMALEDQEREIETSGKEVDKYGQQFDEGTNHIASSIEGVSEGVLEALNQAHATLLQALEEASCNIEIGVTKLIDEDKQNTEQLTEETDAVLRNVVEGSKQAMDTVVDNIELANNQTVDRLSTLAATTDRLITTSHRHQSTIGAHASTTNAIVEVVNKEVARCIDKMEDLEETYLAKEYQVYTPSGETPVRQQYQYPRALAATSPHERVLSRYRAARRRDDDECILVESDDHSASDYESSEDSAVFAAPSPPAPLPAPLPAPRNSGGNLMKSTSETDIYTRKKQQGKENTEHTITVSSLKKPSKLPAPTSNKKPLSDRHNTIS